MDNGNRQIVLRPNIHPPKAAAMDASITINEMTPALTALPIFAGSLSLIALSRDGNIIMANNNRNGRVCQNGLGALEAITPIAIITNRYIITDAFKDFVLPP